MIIGQIKQSVFFCNNFIAYAYKPVIKSPCQEDTPIHSMLSPLANNKHNALSRLSYTARPCYNAASLLFSKYSQFVSYNSSMTVSYDGCLLCDLIMIYAFYC